MVEEKVKRKKERRKGVPGREERHTHSLLHIVF